MNADSDNVLVIDAQKAQGRYLKDLYRFRDLFFFFAWRDILIRYKQAFFGIAWAVIRPLLSMLAFTLLFGKMAHLPSEGVPYSLFVLAGMLPWQLCSNATMDACHSLINNSQLVTKTYFPRSIIPLSGIIVHLVDFAIAAAMLIVLAIIMGAMDPWTWMAIPLFTALTIALCAGVGLWLSALTVQYRDFKIIVPFFMQFGMFISPVGYGTFIVPEKWMWIYFCNPLVGIIDGFRWAFFGVSHPYIGLSLTFSVSISALLLATGFVYFRKMERQFADKI
jgi:lipopolysaccharide transport system permease protein